MSEELLCAGICALPLGALAITAILIREKKKTGLKVLLAVLGTALLFFASLSIMMNPVISGAPSPLFRPSVSEIAGMYSLANSTEYLQMKGYSSLEATSFIEFHDDKTFITENIPDLVIIGYENNSTHEFMSGKGSWSIEFNSVNREWYLILNFSEINNKPHEQRNHLWLYGRKPPFTLYSMIGDPDSYDWIMYKKP